MNALALVLCFIVTKPLLFGPITDDLTDKQTARITALRNQPPKLLLSANSIRLLMDLLMFHSLSNSKTYDCLAVCLTKTKLL